MALGTKVTAKVAGAATDVAKRLQGYPAVFRRIAREHAEVVAMMERVAISKDGAHVRDELFREIREALLSHTRAEEAEFYPALREHPEIDALVSACVAEHEHIEEYLKQLEAGDPASSEWTELFARTLRAVEAHIEREEKELFPQAVESMSDDEVSDLAERFGEAEEQEQARF